MLDLGLSRCVFPENAIEMMIDDEADDGASMNDDDNELV